MTTSSNGTGAAAAAPTLTELAQHIQSHMDAADEAKEQGERAFLEHVLDVGDLLAQAKHRVPHGRWVAWLKQNFSGHPATARSYMQLAANRKRVTSRDLKSVDQALREIRGPRKPRTTSDPKRKRAAGSRLRGLHAKQKVDHTRLTQTRITLMKLVGVLEGINLPEVDITDADGDTINEIHQELTIAATWIDQSLAVVAGQMRDEQIIERIRKLREDTNGRSPAEAATAVRLAEKLERRLHQPSIR